MHVCGDPELDYDTVVVTPFSSTISLRLASGSATSEVTIVTAARAN